MNKAVWTKKKKEVRRTNVLLTDEDKRMIIKYAIKYGLSVSEYMRRKALDLPLN